MTYFLKFLAEFIEFSLVGVFPLGCLAFADLQASQVVANNHHFSLKLSDAAAILKMIVSFKRINEKFAINQTQLRR